MHEMMRIKQPTQAVTPMLLRNADGAVSPHPDSDPKAFAMDEALKYPRAMTPRYATNMNGRRLRLGDGNSPTSPWRLFGRLIFLQNSICSYDDRIVYPIKSTEAVKTITPAITRIFEGIVRISGVV
jgi:hypothetical protein